MRFAKKTLVSLLAFLLFLMTHSAAISVVAAQLAQPKVTTLSNNFIKVTVDNATGRFGIRTVEGQPIRKKDQNVNLLFGGDDPKTSFTTFRIDGTDYIFGNPYKFAPNIFSEVITLPLVENPNGTQQLETIWKIKGVAIKQILMLYMDPNDRKNAGNVNVRYEVYNGSGARVELGSRILLDTMVAGKDGPEFQIGTAYRAPLTVERKLVHDPVAAGIPEADAAYYKLPPYWVMRDNLDLSNPLATNVIAYGFNNISESRINVVDEMIVGHWNGLANTKWDYEVNPNLDFTRDTNDYGTADSAVAFYWTPKPLEAGQSASFETIYGLGEIVAPDKVFSIRFLDPVQQLAALPDSSAYENEGIFDIIAEVENLPAFNMEHNEIKLNMSLESGLSFVKLDEQGRIVRDLSGKALAEPFRSKELILKKPATTEEAEKGIVPKYKPGDTIAVTFKVIATGKPWPTTKQYLLTARSPETQAKLDGISNGADEGVMAEYESSQANFVLLPPIGQAAATYAYALSPKELYRDDIKYITVNLTNIEAYNTGDANTDPNFDLFLQEKGSGKRYKVPVKESVLLQPTDSGASGDMRIAYRGGQLVDKNGIVIQSGLGPELPLGEYQMQIDYKGDAGGDPEFAELFDLTTAQTILVTDNNAARIRQANILAVYKQNVNLANVPLSASEQQLIPYNEAFHHKPFAPGGQLAAAKVEMMKAWTAMSLKSRAIDPSFDTRSLEDAGTLVKVPMYNYALFGSDDEVNAFFANRNDREKLVTIRGMIREVGTGLDKQVVVDTKTEPAIINEAVSYQGKDIAFVRGNLEAFGVKYTDVPFLDTLFVKGDGVLSVTGSGFVFHRGQWTLDFYNGFDKRLGAAAEDKATERSSAEETRERRERTQRHLEDSSLNGSLKWAHGGLEGRLNALRQIMIPQLYFNRQSLFNSPAMSVGGFQFQLYDAMLVAGGVSFGGNISFKIVNAEIKNVVFNDKGFVGVDAALRFGLNRSIGMFVPQGEGSGATGEITVVHYEQPVPGISNRYGVEFEARLDNIATVGVEFALKKVADGRILPDVVAFGAELPKPGVLITGATYLYGIRGAIRELADTIAGGTANEPFPLTIEAGVSLRFGIAPAYHFGDIDLTLKRTGIKIEGSLAFSTKADPKLDDLVQMITYALIEAQWVTPWFVRAAAEVDVKGWDIIVGKAGIFVGQNLEKNRIDFEGFIGAKVKIPDSVPIVGGIPLASVFFGLNNDKIWGSVGVLLISLGITYYWGGGIEFGTSGEGLPDGLIHMVIEDPEKGPQLVVIGQGIETVATSWHNPEKASQGILYREVADGVKVIEQGTMNVGLGGITVRNGGREHQIPFQNVTGNALLEVTYDEAQIPEMVLRDGNGAVYPIVYDNTNTNPQANAFTQFIPAEKSPDQVDSRKAYIIVPVDRTKQGGAWTLTSVKPVETKLLNVPTTPKLDRVSLTKDGNDANRFTASWSVQNAKQGDTVSLYLAKDPVASSMNRDQAPQPGDPGLLIAKDVPVAQNGGTAGSVTNGQLVIDATRVPLLGDTEDIRGLLRQGEYYLRAELKSFAGYETKTSAEKFEIVDPYAPGNVQDVKIEPAGNGMFSLSFRPPAKKPGHESFEHSYVIQALSAKEGSLKEYPNFAELLFTEKELESYWNAATGRYEGMMLGGWTKVSKPNGANDAQGEERYIGLETGREYVVGVASAVKPPKNVDKNENYRFAKRTDSAMTLLPVPVHPKLREAGASGFGSKIDVLTSRTEQTVSLVADQTDVEVEAFYNGDSIGKTMLANEGGQSRGELSFDRFRTDGTYPVELVAKNMRTKDKRITLLDLTVDTIAPILYLDQPLTGERTKDGSIRVEGRTTNDANLTVNGTVVPIDRNGDGKFNQAIPVASTEPVVTLEFIARDDAGNENRATVQVTNDSFQAPVALLLREMKLMSNGSRKIEASLRLPDGKTADGKPKFKTVAIPDSDYEKLLKFNVQAGSAISVAPNGRVNALSVGTSLVRAEYRVSDDVVLQADLPISVGISENVGLADLGAYTTAIQGVTGKTKVSIANAGDLIGHQLVYQLFGAGVQARKPQYMEQLDGWALLPADGVIAVSPGSRLIVAKRTSQGKEAVASSGVIAPNVWSPTMMGGGGGGGPMPSPGGKQSFTLNDAPVKAEWKDNILVATITAKDVAAVGNDEIVIASGDKASIHYMLRFERGAVEAAAAAGKRIVIDLPNAKLTLTPEQLKLLTEDLEIQIYPNGATERSAAGALATSLNVELLGDGMGTTVRTNMPASSFERTWAKVAIPEHIRIQDITAVVLQSPDGHWTPVPWTIDMLGNDAYAEAALTGEGSLFFLRNENSFADVPADFWGKPSIQNAAAKLFVLGKGENSFDPESSVTRAEFPTILLRAAGFMNQAGESDFRDVGDGDWFQRSVGIAARLGVVNGMADGSYAPQATLTRIEGMTMVGRLLGVMGIGADLSDQETETLLSGFADGASVPDWARKPAALAVKYGIILGIDSNIDPSGQLTRTQAAAIAERIDKLLNSMK